MEAAAREDVDAPAGGLNLDEAPFYAQLDTELPGPGLLGKEGVRAPVDDAVLHPLGEDAPAQALVPPARSLWRAGISHIKNGIRIRVPMASA